MKRRFPFSKCDEQILGDKVKPSSRTAFAALWTAVESHDDEFALLTATNLLRSENAIPTQAKRDLGGAADRVRRSPDDVVTARRLRATLRGIALWMSSYIARKENALPKPTPEEERATISYFERAFRALSSSSPSPEGSLEKHLSDTPRTGLYRAVDELIEVDADSLVCAGYAWSAIFHATYESPDDESSPSLPYAAFGAAYTARPPVLIPREFSWIPIRSPTPEPPSADRRFNVAAIDVKLKRAFSGTTCARDDVLRLHESDVLRKLDSSSALVAPGRAYHDTGSFLNAYFVRASNVEFERNGRVVEDVKVVVDSSEKGFRTKSMEWFGVQRRPQT